MGSRDTVRTIPGQVDAQLGQLTPYSETVVTGYSPLPLSRIVRGSRLVLVDSGKVRLRLSPT